MKDFNLIESRVGHRFYDRSLLRMALTHRTFSKEREIGYDNQRLEFLGDAVLQLILSDALFFRHPDNDEGQLTKTRSVMVKEPTLAHLARHLDLGNAIMLGRGEVESGGAERDSLLCDVLEAVIGAIYLDAGIDVTRMIVLRWIQTLFPDLSVIDDDNPKGNLQELSTKYDLGNITYEEVAASGPDHAKKYNVRVTVGKNFTATGCATKRKKAEAVAARAVLSLIRSQHPDFVLFSLPLPEA